MVYCEQCGAANDIMNRQCHRCGHTMPAETGSGPLDGASLTHNAPPDAAGPSLSANLDLPDWLKQAAEETPPSPNAFTAPLGQAPAGFHVAPAPPSYPTAPLGQMAQPVAPAMPQAYAAPVNPMFAAPAYPTAQAQPQTYPTAAQPATYQPAAAPAYPPTAPSAAYPAADLPPAAPVAQAPFAPVQPRPQQLPPVPTGDLQSTLPDWLRNQAPQQTPAAPAIQMPKPQSVDTSSFISEGDLPEWIRQIAAADAVKKAEEDRVAALAAAQVAAVVANEPTRKQPLPGETIGTSANNPWLARREAHAAAMSWGAPAPVEQGAQFAAAPAVEEAPPEVVHFDPPAPEATKSKSMPKLAMPKVSMPKANLTMPSMPKLNLPASTPSENASPLIRYGLITAVVLLVLIVVIGVVL